MLGAIVVNENNAVVHVFGDAAFREAVLGSDLSSAPSTSSGIFSDRKSPFIELSADKPTDYVHEEIDHNEILQVFLPLILLYRTMQEKNDENYESMVMDRLQILFKESETYLLIGVTDDSVAPFMVQKFMAEVDAVLGFHYGPMIKLVKADFPSIRKIRSKVERRIQYLIAEYTSGKNCAAKVYSTDLNVAYRTIVSDHRLLDALTAIPHQLQMCIGTSRCFFLKDGKLIASENTTPNSIPTVNRFSPADLRNIVQFVQLSMNSSKTSRGTMEQVWLKLRPDGHRQIVNLFVVPLSEDINMVCISSVNGSGLIEQLCTVVGMLDIVRPGEDLLDRMSAITVLLQKFCDGLRNLLPTVAEVAASGGLSQFTFLRDTNRSATLLENLWSRLLSQISQQQQQPSYPTPTSTPRRGSFIQRLRDSSSTLSNRWGSATSIQSSCVSSTRHYSGRSTGFPVHVDALVAHFQRQLHNVMNELCSQAFYVAYNYKFDTLVKRVQRITVSLSRQVTPLDVSPNGRQSLSPLQMGFDMKAYFVLALDTRLSFSFCTEEQKGPMLEYADRPAFRRRMRKVIVEGKEHLLVELSNALDYRQPQPTIVTRLRRIVSREKKPVVESIQHLTSPLFCAFLFDVFVNVNLASRQSDQLSLLLYEKMLTAQASLR
uniref:Protein kinase domain-containing protein n=1 Tax=Steinernema glaseri TaxID=37863 RepID=A0A1I7ZBI4_9BILA